MTWCLWTVHESQADLLSYNASIEWVTWSLDLIHLNVVEPIMLIVYDSSRWFVTLTDNFTRFTWMFFMKIKDETVKHIKNFVTLMKTDCSDYSLKCLHTDFEYKYLVLKNWFTVNDIIWEPTVPYSPEENSISERLNRTICEPAQAMLKDSDLNSHSNWKSLKLQFISRTSLLLEYSTWHSMKHEQTMFLTSQVFTSLISLLKHTFLRNNVSKKLSLRTAALNATI
jgi:hypothetical protein